MEYDYLLTFIRDLLSSGKDNNTVQHELLELLGQNCLEFIIMLIQKRVCLTKQLIIIE
jgi:hypothetical protein